MTEPDAAAAQRATLNRKKRSRVGHRASATRLINQATTALEATDEVDKDQLQLTKQLLLDKIKLLKTLDEEIADLVPEDQLEEEIQQADQQIERVYMTIAKITKALGPPSRATTPTPPVERGGTGPPAADPPESPATGGGGYPPIPRDDPVRLPTPTTTTDRVKLPKISLPHFRGDLLRWTAFWDSFESAVHSNDRLSEIDKFNYLRSLLEGTAYDAVAGLALSASNYEQAVEILKKRFGNKQLIVSKHMETLLSFSAITADNHLRDLRRLFDQAEANIRSLRALGVEPESYGTMLSSVLLSKLPPELRLIVSRKVPADNLDMGTLLETFEQELIARERATSVVQPPNRRVRPPGQQTTSAFVSTTTGSPECVFCGQSHASTTCQSVPTADGRKRILRSSGRCYNCLRKNHLSKNCRSTSKCRRCNGRHHTSICAKEQGQETLKKQESEPPNLAKPLDPAATAFQPGAQNDLGTPSLVCSTHGKAILLQTARAIIFNPLNPKQNLEVRFLFDSGSQRSYTTDRVMKQLQLKPSGEQTLAIAAFGATQGQAKVCPIVSIGVRLRGYPNMTLSLHVVPTICEPLLHQPVTASIESHDQLMSLDLADSADVNARLPVDVLIGCDHYWELVTGSVCRNERGPTAIHTKLGWVLSGPTNTPIIEHTSSYAVTTHSLRAGGHPMCTGTAQLNEQLRSFWELESLGIIEEEKTLYEEFAATIRFQDGRYKVPLPWKEFHEPLGDNYQLCEKRLKGLLKRLRHEPEVLEQYNSTIQDQLERGIIEPAPQETKGTIHYLPHHGVVRSDKMTTKLRVVYDASSKTSGPSLNECLYKGPKFQQLILDLLIRFRAYKVAVIADVEKAFLMIAVDEGDRDVLRFLWVDDVTKDEPEIRAYRFTRVVFGVSSSPFLLNATVKYHLESFRGTNKTVVEKLLKSTYVDDIISGADNIDEAFELYTQAKEIFRKGGFNLRKFLSNCQPLQMRVDAAEQLPEATESEGKRAPVKVLGVSWNSSDDTLAFDLSELSSMAMELHPTKRNVVSLVGRFYDPLGYLSPVTIRFKTLFQRLCQARVDWDEDLPDALLKEWRLLIADLREAVPISIPRSYHYRVEGTPHAYTLCGFCDASVQAYAAVVYLVMESDVSTDVKFMVAKTRVAPLQTQTIPRLELLSAFLLSKLVSSVADCLSSTLPKLGFRCYTDSQVALYWIQGTTKEWKPFVDNRVREIRSRVKPSCWSHCPGISNPADLPSRGLSCLELSVSRLWRLGPEWLLTGFEPSPRSEVLGTDIPKECVPEMKATQSHTLVTTEPNVSIESLLEPTAFSTLPKLLGTTAMVLRAVRRFKRGKREAQLPVHAVEERKQAEILWVKSAQQLFTNLQNLTKQFNLFKDEHGVWRCGGRLANIEVPFETKFPILIPRSHYLSTLIVKQAHERVLHDGVKETLAEIRSKFWIPSGRSFTRRVINTCVTCRKFEGLPFKTPQPPPLPECRVKEAPAFSFTGVDFAGPLLVRATLTSPSTKVWISLFTCYVTRAVHLDVVPDQSTLTFIRCLKRFVARRGLPSQFISDNGKTFKAAAKYLDAVFKDGTLQTHLNGIGVTWKFNVERAPWWGGAFERMVRSTKRCLKKLIGRSHISLDELTTALAEIEAVLNSRPLSYVSSEDLDEPVTPSHLIVGRRLLSLPDNLDYLCDPDDEEFTLDKSQVTSRVRHLNNLLNHFWRRWRTEYLGCLREVHSQLSRKTRGDSSVIARGDVVIVKDEHLPRGHWKLGVVQELLTGRDGLTRAAVVKVAGSNRQQSSLKRPIQLLYPLEIRSDIFTATSSEDTPESISEPESCEQDGENVDSVDPLTRPKRDAARRARKVTNDWITELEKDD